MAVVLREQVIVVAGGPARRTRQTRAYLAARDRVLPSRANPLRLHLESCFVANGQDVPSVDVESGSVLFITALLRHSGALSCLPDGLCRREIESRRLTSVDCPALDWRREVVVVWHKELPLSPAASALLEILRDMQADA